MYGDVGRAILALREKGYSYRKIEKELKCSRSTICYHCGKGQKEMNAKRRKKRRLTVHPYEKKREVFINRLHKETYNKTIFKNNPKSLFYFKYHTFIERIMEATFTLDELIVKLGENPICYLTGEEIDISKTSTYEFDHIIPRSRGGTNDLDNLAICSKKVNRSKMNMTPDEFLNLCKKVLVHNGYKVEPR